MKYRTTVIDKSIACLDAYLFWYVCARWLNWNIVYTTQTKCPAYNSTSSKKVQLKSPHFSCKSLCVCVCIDARRLTEVSHIANKIILNCKTRKYRFTVVCSFWNIILTSTHKNKQTVARNFPRKHKIRRFQIEMKLIFANYMLWATDWVTERSAQWNEEIVNLHLRK